MYLDKKSPIPIYCQLKNLILKKIQDGEFPPGSLIPSERDLGEKLNISRMTVRQALNQLVAEGVLYREKGKGTFVSKVKIEQRNIMSFSEIVRKKGLVPTTKVLHFIKQEAGGEIGGILGLDDREMIYVVKRLRLASNIPVGIEEDFIPEKYCPDLEKYDLTASLYKLIKEEYGYAISYMDNVIEASKPSREEKELLNMPANVPVLKITSVNFVESDLKLFYEKSIYRSDEYKYNVRVYVNKNME
ncbi:MAG: GntR family transcriptional regulator [Firmicutes bacterium]|nr:GntR family transcriptional regulator [Bacillota bacterium]